jgi:enterobactin synthetase component D
MSFVIKQQSFELGNKLVLHWVEYNFKAYNSGFFSRYAITPPDQLLNWVNKRQAQFLAGRIAAKNSLPVNFKNQTVGIGRHREPLWPKGFMGSISHDKEISIALSQEQLSGGIGVDIQTTFEASEAEINKDIILSRSEKVLLRDNIIDLSDRQLLTLIFSAKECFFKAVFNQVGEYINFKDVSIKSIDTKTLKIYLVSDRKLTEKIIPNRNYVVDYLWINKNKIITVLNATD